MQTITFSTLCMNVLCLTDGKRGKISDVFEQDEEDGGGPLQRTLSQPDFFFDGDEQRNRQPRGSLFARPGFGSVAFRCVESSLPRIQQEFAAIIASHHHLEDYYKFFNT